MQHDDRAWLQRVLSRRETSMDQDSVAGQDQKICRSSEAGGGAEPSPMIEPDWELLERATRQESIGVAIVLAVTTAMAAAIKLSGF